MPDLHATASLHLAPAISSSAFRKIIAKEPPRPDLTGKFWALMDTDDDSDVDDLGDADTKPHETAGDVRKKMVTSPLPGIRWPWVKPWRGPLPKRQNMVVTIADYVGAAIKAKANNHSIIVQPPRHDRPTLSTIAATDGRSCVTKSIAARDGRSCVTKSKGDGPLRAIEPNQNKRHVRHHIPTLN